MKPRILSAARLSFSLASAIAALLYAPSAHATAYYWDVDGTTAGFSTVVGAWNTGAFWGPNSTGTGGTYIVNPTAADDLNIVTATTNTGTITVTGAKTASSITFASGVGAVTISGGTSITIGGTGASSGIFNASASAQVISTPLILRAASTAVNFSNSAAGLLTIGAVTGAATTGTQTINVGSSGAGGITLNGIIGNGAGGGTVALSINNTSTGVTTLSGANTYTGTTTISNGTLTVGNATALGTNAAGTTISSGATLNINAQNLGTEVLTVSGAGVGGLGAIVNNGGDQIDATGRIVMTGNTTFGGTGRWDLRNSTPTLNMGGFTLTKTGANTVSLVAVAVSNPGNVIVNQGIFSVETATNLGGTAANTITVNNPGTLQFYQNSVPIPWSIALNDATMSQINTSTTVTGGVTLTGANTIKVDGTSLTLNGAVSGTGFSKTGPGLLTLGGTNTYTGTATVTAGTLNLTGSLAATSSLKVDAGTTFSMVNSAGTNQTLNLLNLGSGTGTATLDLELGSTSAYDRLAATGAGTTANAVKFNLSSLPAFGAGSYTLLSAASGLDSATYTLGRFPGGFGYTLTPSATSVQLGVTAGATGNLYWADLGTPITSWNAVNLTTGATNFSTDLAGTTNSNTIPGSANTVVYRATTVTSNLSHTLDAKFSVDSLVFNAAAGTTTAIAPGVADSTLTLNPANSANGIAVGDNAGAITISAPMVVASGQTWNVSGVGSPTLTLTGAISGAGGIVKEGAGSLVLGTASNTFTSPVVVKAGTLQVNTTASLPASGAIMDASGTLFLNNANATFGQTVSGAGTVSVKLGTAAETTTLSGNWSNFTGTLDVGPGAFAGAGKINFSVAGNFPSPAATIKLNANTTLYGNAGILGSRIDMYGGTTGEAIGQLRLETNAWVAGPVTLYAGTTIGNNNAGNLGVIAGAIGENGGARALNKIAAGNIALAGSNTFSGGLTVTAGNIFVNSSRALGTGSLTMAGGGLDNTSGLAITNSNNNAQAWNANFTFAANADYNIGTGVVTISADRTVTVNSRTFAVGGVIDDGTGPFSLTKAGSGTLLLTGANTYSGNTSITGGALAINNDAALGDTASSSLTLNAGTLRSVANVTLGSSRTVTLAGAGTLAADPSTTLAVPQAIGGAFGLASVGEGTVNLGGTIAATSLAVSNGTVRLSGDTGANQLTAATAVTVSRNGVLINGPAVPTVSGLDRIVNTASLTLAHGTLTMADPTTGLSNAQSLVNLNNNAGFNTINGSNAGTANTLTFTGAAASNYTRQVGAVLNFTSTGGLTTSFTNAPTANVSGGILVGALLNGTDFVTAAAATTLAAPAYTADTWATGNNTNVTGNATVALNSTTNSLRIATGNPVLTFQDANNTLTSGGILVTSGATGTTLAGGGLRGLASADLWLHNDAPVTLRTVTFDNTAATGFTKSGIESLLVATPQLYTGTTTVNGGTVTAHGTQYAFGVPGATALNLNVGNLQLVHDVTVNYGKNLTLNNSSTITLDRVNAGDGVAYTLGTLTMPYTSTLNIANGVKVTGGTSTLNIGRWTVGAVNPTTNGSVPTATLNIGSGVVLNVTGNANGAPNQYSDVVKTGGGTLILSGANTFWEGPAIALQQGTLDIRNAQALGENSPVNGAITASAATTLRLTNDAAMGVQATPLVITGDNVNVISDRVTAGGGVTHTIGQLSTNGAYTINFQPGAGVTSGTAGVTFATNNAWSSIGGNLTVNVSNATAGLNGAIGAMQVTFNSLTDGGGAYGITKTGDGILTLGGYGDFTGSVNLNAGTLNINYPNALGTGSLTIAGGTTINNSSGAAVFASTNNAQAWNGDFTFTGSANLNLGTGAVTLNGNRTLTTVANTLTVGGAIGDGGGGFGLTKEGLGTLALTGTSTYGGATRVNFGTLALDLSQSAATSILPATTAVTLGGGTLSLKGSPAGTSGQTVAGLVLDTRQSIVAVNGNNNNSATTLNLGPITRTADSGAVLNVQLTGTGATVATSNSNVNGLLGTWATVGTGTSQQYATVSAGTLAAATTTTAAPDAWTSATANYLWNGTGAPVTLNASRTAHTATLPLTAASIIDLGIGANTLTVDGLLNNSTNALTIRRGPGGTGTLVVGADKELVLSGQGSYVINVPIVDNGGGASGLTINSGDVTLGAANTFTGPVVVNGTTTAFGTLNMNDAGALAGASSIKLVNTGASAGNGTRLVINGAYTVAAPVTMVSDNNYRTAIIGNPGAGNTATVNSGIILQGNAGGINQFFANSGTLALNGNISGPYAGTMFFRGSTTGIINVNGTVNAPNAQFSITDGTTINFNPTGGTPGIWANTTVANGTLKLGAANILPTGTVLTTGQSGTNTVTVDLSGFNQTVAGLVDINTGGTHAITSAGAATLTVNNATDFSYAGLLSGALSLTKQGTGTLSLTNNANTATGTVTVNNGTLNIAPGAGYTTSYDVVLNGGTLQNTAAFTTTLKSLAVNAAATINLPGTGLSNKIQITAHNVLTGSGAITLTGTSTTGGPGQTGVLLLNGNQTGFTGDWIIRGASVEAQTPQAFGSGTSPIQLFGGEIALSGTGAGRYTRDIDILAAGAYFGADNSSGGNQTIYSGTLDGGTNNFNIRVGNFHNSTGASNLTLDGTLQGSGVITLVPTIGQTTAGVVKVIGNTTGFTGQIVPASNLAVLAVTSANAGLLSQLVATQANTTIGLIDDGNGTSTPQAIPFLAPASYPVNTSTILVDRVGGQFSPTLFLQAANKTLQIAAPPVSGASFGVTNLNGYGLEVTGAQALTGTPVYTVNTASISTVTQGLTLSGQLTGTAGLSKAGPGTLVLTADNSATLLGNLVVNNGVLSVGNSVLPLGAGNVVLTPSVGATATFRVTDNLTTSKVIDFGNTTDARAIEVSEGKTLTLSSAFGKTTPAANLVKRDNGNLALTADNTTVTAWTGGLSVWSGAVQLGHNSAAGTGTIGVRGASTTGGQNFGGAIELAAGGLTITNTLTLNSSGADGSFAGSGINGTGALHNTGGTNTWSGGINVTNDGWITADSGTTLNLTGLITQTLKSLHLGGAGAINISNHTTGGYGITKRDSGTVNITSAVGTMTNNLTFLGGTLILSGANGSFAGTAAAGVQPGATVWVNDTGTAKANRFGARALTLNAGTFRYSANGTAASTETIGALTPAWGGNKLEVINGGAANSTLTFASLTAIGGGGTLDFVSGTIFGTNANKVVFTAVPTLTNGIIPRATVNGADYATYTSGSIAAYAGYVGNINAASATETPNVSGDTTLVATRLNTPINALKLTGDGIDLNAAFSGQTLTPSTGNILVTGNAPSTPVQSTIGSGGMVIAMGGNEGAFLVNTGSTLDIQGAVTGTNNLTTGGGGTVKFSQRVYDTTTAQWLSVTGGTTMLNAGNSTFLPGIGLAVPAGGKLDLNGNAQLFRDLNQTSAGGFAGQGGEITSTASATLALSNPNSNFGGRITGDVFLAKSGASTNTLNLNDNNTYTGGTLVNGGYLTLQNSGRLSGTASIDLNYCQLRLFNSEVTSHTDRINDAAPITMRGAWLVPTGRLNTAVSETMGSLTAAQGYSGLWFSGLIANNAPSSVDLLIDSLSRTAANGATIGFHNADNQLGTIGNAYRVKFNTAPTLTNYLIGPWAVVNGTEFASYDTTYGVGALNQTGFAGYHDVALPTSDQPTWNVRTTVSDTVKGGGVTVNTYNMAGNANLSFSAASDTLNLAGGGLLKSGNNANSIGTVALPGQLTAGGATPSGLQDLFLYNNQNTLTINSKIVDNGGAAVRAIFSSSGGNYSLTNANTHTGGTVLNGRFNTELGTLSLNGAPSTVVIPAGGLTINHGSVTMVTNAGQIAPSNVVTMNGGSTLTLVGSNSLAGLVMNNDGGHVNPTVTTGGILTLPGGASIQATSSNPAFTATINGTLDYTGAASAPSIQVAPIAVNGQSIAPWQETLTIDARVQNSAFAISKTGTGVLRLNGASTFANGLNLTTGGIMVGANTTQASVAIGAPVFSGPLGTGTLAIAAGTRLLASGAYTVGNAATVAGDFEFAGTNNLTLTGLTTFTPAATDVTVSAPQMTATIAPAGTNKTITKLGLGTLQMIGSSPQLSGTSAVNINAGTLMLSAASGTQPAGTATLNLNAGLLDLRSNGSNGSTFAFGNNVALDPAATASVMNLGGANTGNTFLMGDLSMTAGVNNLNVFGGNNNRVQFATTNLTTAYPATAATFTPAAATTIILPGGFSNANKPVNAGAGLVIYSGSNTFTGNTIVTATTPNGAAPATNSIVTPFGTGSVELQNNAVFTLSPVVGTFSSTDYTAGAPQTKWSSFSTAVTTMGAQNAWGAIAAANITGQGTFSDLQFRGAPPLLGNASFSNSLVTYNSLLNVTTAGNYFFGGGSDDQLIISVDGSGLVYDVGTGHGIDTRTAGSIYLTAGLHQVAVKAFNIGSGGGNWVTYGGPDTATNGIGGTTPNMQSIPLTAVYGSAGLPAAGNSFLNAGRVGNAFTVTGTAATINGTGTDFNSSIASLSINSSSTLTVQNHNPSTNVGGLGMMVVEGVTTVTGTGAAILSPTSGTLYLAGGVSDTAQGLNKTGDGTLILGQTTGGTFTGTFNATAGFVQVAHADALSTGAAAGANTIGAGATLDLNGTTGLKGNITINGTGSARKFATNGAALYNSSATTASLDATSLLTIGTAGTQVSGYGNIDLNGTVAGSVAWAKYGPNTLSLNGNNSFTGALTVAQGVVKLGHANALGGIAGNTVISSGATLDLNGQTVTLAEPLSIGGPGTTGLAIPNTLGSLVNNSASAASFAGPITLTGGVALGTSSLVPGATGDITLSGVIGGGNFGMNKVGANTLILTNTNTFQAALTIVSGAVTVSGANGTAGATNSAPRINSGGTLTLDNSGANRDNRLGGREVFTNGNLTILGNPAAPTNELISVSGKNLNFENSGSVVTLSPHAAQPLVLNITSNTALTRAAGATTLFRGTNLGANPVATPGAGNAAFSAGTQADPGFVGQNGANGANNKGILPYALIDQSASGFGTGFASHDIDNGFRSLAGIEQSATLADNANVSTTAALVAPTGITTINSLQLGTGGGLTIGAGSTIALDSGGLLATDNATISGAGRLTSSSNREIIVHTPGTSTDLTISTVIGGTTGGLTKADAGTLVLSALNTYTGNTWINGGTLKLSGGDNTIFANPATTPGVSATPAGTVLSDRQTVVNLGATLQLDGSDQVVHNLISSSTVPGAGGTVTSSTGSTVRYVSNDVVRTFAGSFTGDVNLNRAGGNVLTLSGPSTTTGTVTLTGGRTDLVDLGTFQNASAITIRQAGLVLNNGGTEAVANRLKTTAPISLESGAFGFNGRAGTQDAASIGAVTVAGGSNVIGVTATNGTATLTLASLTRAANHASVMFAGATGDPIPLSDLQRIFISSAPTLTNGLIGPWATVYDTQGLTFATYDPATGIRALNTTYGYAPAGVYDAAQNVRFGASATLPAGGATVNTLTLSAGAANTLSFAAAGDTLTVAGGGILADTAAFTKTIGGAANQGIITTGVGQQELFIHNGATNALTVNSSITDNGNPVSVILNGRSANNINVTLAGNNTYTGTTYSNGLILTLNSTGAPAIPGNLVINGATAAADSMAVANSRVLLSQNDQIAATGTVTIRGTAQLDLNAKTQTLANLVFENPGGSNGRVGPALVTGAGTLTLTGQITAQNLDNLGTVPQMQGNLNLGGATRTVQVALVAGVPDQIGLAINSVISNGGLTKTGAGILALGGLNTYSGATTVNAGTLTLGNNLALQNSALVTTGAGAVALGTGITTPTLGGLSGATGDLATVISSGYGNVTALTLNPGTGATAAYGGVIANGATGMTLTKSGAGIQILSGTNSYTGATSVNQGTLLINGDQSAATGLVTVAAGAKLGGVGTIGGATTVNGTLAIGTSPGTMTFNSDLGLNVGSISDFEINSFTMGEFDLAKAATAGTQTVTFGGGALNLLFQSGFSTEGSVKIFDFDTYAGTGFTTVNPTGLADGYTASFEPMTGMVTVIPEPRAALLGGLGLLALLRRRRTNHQS